MESLPAGAAARNLRPIPASRLRRAPPAAPGQCCRRFGRRYQTWRTIAQCRWPRALWVQGSGPWASVKL